MNIKLLLCKYFTFLTIFLHYPLHSLSVILEVTIVGAYLHHSCTDWHSPGSFLPILYQKAVQPRFTVRR